MVAPVLSLTDTVPGPGTEPKKAALAVSLPSTAIKRIERLVEPTSLRNSLRLSSETPVGMTSPSRATSGEGITRALVKVDPTDESNASANLRRLDFFNTSLPR